MVATKKEKNRVAETNGHAGEVERVSITPLRMRVVTLRIIGTAPYVQLAFGKKAETKMAETMMAGQQAKGKKVREPRDFDEDFRQALHRMPDGTYGIPAAALRAGCISACRMVGFKMTHAKLSVFIEADGFDVNDGTAMVKIVGEPESVRHAVRNANGSTDLRVRAMWREWHADVRVRFDEGQFSVSDVVNLLSRAGAQVGIGEGRPDSRQSAGMGWGTFSVEGV